METNLLPHTTLLPGGRSASVYTSSDKALVVPRGSLLRCEMGQKVRKLTILQSPFTED